MKTAALLLALLATVAWCDDIKLANGTVVQGKIGILHPAMLDIITDHGTVAMPWQDIDIDWKIANLKSLPEAKVIRDMLKIQADQATLKAQTEAAIKENGELHELLSAALAENKKLRADSGKPTLLQETKDLSGSKGIKIANIGCKQAPEEASDGYVYYTWRAEITNNTDHDMSNILVGLSGRDTGDFEVLKDSEMISRLRAGETAKVGGKSISDKASWRASKRYVVSTR